METIQIGPYSTDIFSVEKRLRISGGAGKAFNARILEEIQTKTKEVTWSKGFKAGFDYKGRKKWWRFSGGYHVWGEIGGKASLRIAPVTVYAKLDMGVQASVGAGFTAEISGGLSGEAGVSGTVTIPSTLQTHTTTVVVDLTGTAVVSGSGEASYKGSARGSFEAFGGVKATVKIGSVGLRGKLCGDVWVELPIKGKTRFGKRCISRTQTISVPSMDIPIVGGVFSLEKEIPIEGKFSAGEFKEEIQVEGSVKVPIVCTPGEPYEISLQGEGSIRGGVRASFTSAAIVEFSAAAMAEAGIRIPHIEIGATAWGEIGGRVWGKVDMPWPVPDIKVRAGAGAKVSGELSAWVRDLQASIAIGGQVSGKAIAELEGTISGEFTGTAKVTGTARGICPQSPQTRFKECPQEQTTELNQAFRLQGTIGGEFIGAAQVTGIATEITEICPPSEKPSTEFEGCSPEQTSALDQALQMVKKAIWAAGDDRIEKGTKTELENVIKAIERGKIKIKCEKGNKMKGKLKDDKEIIIYYKEGGQFVAGTGVELAKVLFHEMVHAAGGDEGEAHACEEIVFGGVNPEDHLAMKNKALWINVMYTALYLESGMPEKPAAAMAGMECAQYIFLWQTFKPECIINPDMTGMPIPPEDPSYDIYGVCRNTLYRRPGRKPFAEKQIQEVTAEAIAIVKRYGVAAAEVRRSVVKLKEKKMALETALKKKEVKPASIGETEVAQAIHRFQVQVPPVNLVEAKALVIQPDKTPYLTENVAPILSVDIITHQEVQE
jgi:hypothetical protein